MDFQMPMQLKETPILSVCNTRHVKMNCVQYSNPEIAEELRVQMDQAMYACDEHIDESRRQLHRSEDELNEALCRLRQNW